MKHYLSPLFLLALTATTGKLSAAAANLQNGFTTPSQGNISIPIEQHAEDLKAKRKAEKRRKQATWQNHADLDIFLNDFFNK